MKKNSILIYIFILIAVIIIKISISSSQIKTSNDERYIIFDNLFVLKMKYSKFSEVDFNDKAILTNKFNVFVNGNYIGKYNVRKFDSIIRLYDSNNDAVSYSGNIIANNYSDKMKIAKYQTSTINSEDINLANEVLSNNGITTRYSKKESNYYKVSFDLDEDGNEDYLFVLSNMLYDVEEGYSFVFIKKSKSDKVNFLFKDKGSGLSGYEANLISILDVNDDEKYDLIFDVYKFGDSNVCREIFIQNKSKFEKVKSCI